MLLHADCIADYGWMHACETSFSIPRTAAPLSFTSRYTTASADAVFHAVAGLSRTEMSVYNHVIIGNNHVIIA